MTCLHLEVKICHIQVFLGGFFMGMHILAQPEHPFWINLNTYSETN